jgi:pilus assembly protein Flp/PilA
LWFEWSGRESVLCFKTQTLANNKIRAAFVEVRFIDLLFNFERKFTVEIIKNFILEEDGVTAIEYGLIAALVAVAIVAGASALGTGLNGIFTRLAACMTTPTTNTCSAVA